MADEVTKKDLQSIQGTFNKQINDIKKRLDKAESNISILKDVPTAMDEAMMNAYTSLCENLQKQIYQLQSDVAALKKSAS